MGRLLTGALIGIVLIAPVISLIYLEHALFGHHYVPVEWVHSNLELIATETLLGSESILITGPYFMWGVLVSSVAYVRLSRDFSPATWIQGLTVGLFFGFPMILLAYLLTATWTQTLISIFVLVVQFALWGFAYTYIYNRVSPTAEEQESSPAPPQSPPTLGGKALARPSPPRPFALRGQVAGVSGSDWGGGSPFDDAQRRNKCSFTPHQTGVLSGTYENAYQLSRYADGTGISRP